MRRIFLSALCLFFFPAAAAAAPGPVEFVQAAFKDLSRAPVSSAPGLIAKVGRYYDFGGLFDLASQDFQAALAPDQAQRLRTLFVDLLTRRMARKADRLGGKNLQNPDYALLKGRKDGEFTVVLKGTLRGRSVRLEFVLVPHAEVYKIVDLSVEGALLSRNYRGQFNRIFRSEGVDGLEKRLQDQLKTL